MDVGHVRVDIDAAITKVDHAVALIRPAEQAVGQATALLRATATGTAHVFPGDALGRWTQAQVEATDTLARLHEGKGHANAYARSL